MRHATRSQRLSLPTAHRQALLDNLVKGLVLHGQIRTTYARAKEAQRRMDRLVTWGKEGSIHARRLAFRILQDQKLVKRLFSDIAPRFMDTPGGYTRVVRLSWRRGDGAQEAIVAFSRIPESLQPRTSKKIAAEPSAALDPATAPVSKEDTSAKKPKGFFEGLRDLWKRKKRS